MIHGRHRVPPARSPRTGSRNTDIFDFELPATDVEDITLLNKNERTGPDPGQVRLPVARSSPGDVKRDAHAVERACDHLRA